MPPFDYSRTVYATKQRRIAISSGIEPSMQAFDQKLIAATEGFWFDFSRALPEDVIITGAIVSIAVAPNGGVDPTPASMLVSAPAISGNGTQVSQTLTAGLNGVTYMLECIASLANGESLALQALLPVAQYAY